MSEPIDLEAMKGVAAKAALHCDEPSCEVHVTHRQLVANSLALIAEVERLSGLRHKVYMQATRHRRAAHNRPLRDLEFIEEWTAPTPGERRDDE